jgi:hypothetical protein
LIPSALPVSSQNAVTSGILHRQSSLEVSVANSKRQPELATFRERIGGQTYHRPLDERLRMSERGDRLSLAYNHVRRISKWTGFSTPGCRSVSR